MTLAMVYLIYGHLNLVTSSFVAVLLGLGIDFGVHMIHRFNEQRRAGSGVSEAIREAVRPATSAPGAEIVPVGTLTADEGIRPDTTLEKMAALEPAFPGLELITAGNASQLSDGSSASILMEASLAEKRGLEVRPK